MDASIAHKYALLIFETSRFLGKNIAGGKNLDITTAELQKTLIPRLKALNIFKTNKKTKFQDSLAIKPTQLYSSVKHYSKNPYFSQKNNLYLIFIKKILKKNYSQNHRN